MRKDRIELYDDDEAAEIEQRQFRVPWFVRAIEGFFRLVEHVREGIGWVIWICMGGFWWLFDRVMWFLWFVLGPIRWAIDWLLMHTVFSERTEKISSIRFDVIPRLGAAHAFCMSKIAFWSEKSTFVGWLFMPIRLFLTAGVSLLDFLANWLFTRDYRQLLFAIPAVLLMVPLTICMVMIPLKTDQSTARQYQLAAREAIANQELDAARLFYRKISQLRGGRGIAWDLARIAEQNGDFDEAYQHMQELASADEPGLPNAHLWIANAIAGDHVEVQNPQELIKIHLNHVLAVDPKNEFALGMLANYYLTQGDAEKSIETLEKLDTTGQQSELEKQIKLGIANRQAGNVVQGNLLISEADDQFAKIYRESNAMAPASYIIWSSAKELMGEISEAVGIMQLGLQQHPKHESIVSVNRILNLRLIDVLKAQGPNTRSERMELVSKLFALEPENEEILIQIAKMSAEEGIEDQALKLLRPSIDADRLSVPVYDQLALSAMLRGDMDESRRFYRTVVSKDGSKPVALNNLAWLVAHEEPINLDEALQLADKALAILPKNPSIRATRGHILIKQGHWSEAIKELEFGLNGMPGNRKAHTALALAYTRIGEHELADRHKRMIERSRN